MKKLSISKKMLLAILILLPSTDFTLSAQDTLKLDLSKALLEHHGIKEEKDVSTYSLIENLKIIPGVASKTICCLS